MSDITSRLGDQYNPARWPIRFAMPDDAADLRISVPRLELIDGGQYLSCQFDTRFVMHPVEGEDLVIRVGSQRCAILLTIPPGKCPAYFRTDQTTLALSSRMLLPEGPADGDGEVATIEVIASNLQITPTGLSTQLTGTWTVPTDDIAHAPVRIDLWPAGPTLALTSLAGQISNNRLTALGGKAKARIALLQSPAMLDLAWQVTFDGHKPLTCQGQLSLDRPTTLVMPGLGTLEITRLEGAALLSRPLLQVEAALSGRWAQAGVNLAAVSCNIDVTPESARLHVQLDSVTLNHLPAPLNNLELRDAHLTLTSTEQDQGPLPAGQIKEAELHGVCLWRIASMCCTLPDDVLEPAPNALVRLTLHWSDAQPPTLKLSLDVDVGLTGLFDGVTEAWRPRDVTGQLRCRGTMLTGAAGATPLAKVNGQASISLKAPAVLAGHAGPGLAAMPADATFSAGLVFSPGHFKLVGMARDTNSTAELLLRLPPLGSASLRSTELAVEPTTWRVKGSGAFEFGADLTPWLTSPDPWTCDLTAGGPVAGPRTDIDELGGTLRGRLTLSLPTLNAASNSRINLVTLHSLAMSIHSSAGSASGVLKLEGQATLLDNLSLPMLLDGLQPGPLRPLLEPLLSTFIGARLHTEIEMATAPASNGQRPLTLRLTATAPASTPPFSLLGALAALTGQAGPIRPPTIRIDDKILVLDELFAVRTRQTVFTLQPDQQSLTAALTLELNVLGSLSEITVTIGQRNGKPRISILLGDTAQGGEPIVLRIPAPGAIDLKDLIDRVALNLDLDKQLVRDVATALEQFMKAGRSIATFELCDIGIECFADAAGRVMPQVTGTVQMLEMPEFLRPLMPGGFFLTLSSSAEGIKISTGSATSEPLLHLPLDKGSAGKPARTIDLFLDSLSIGYRWSDNSISLGCSAEVKTVPPNLLTLGVKGTGVRVQTPVVVDLEAGLTVTPPPLPIPRWNFQFGAPTATATALDELGAQLFLGDDGTNQAARFWFRNCSFSPIGWMFCPTLTYDAGFVLGGPSPGRKTAAGNPVYTSATRWITALNSDTGSDTFHVHASLEGFTAILVSPTAALVMNPLVFLPAAPPMPPFWVGPNPIGPLADFYFDRVSASIHLPGFLHGSLSLERPLPEFTLETLLSLVALMASGFQARIPHDSPLHRLFYASATVDWLLPFGGSRPQRLSVAVDMVQALEGLGDLVEAAQNVTETVTDLVAGLPALLQKVQQSPTLAVRLIPRESRQFTVDLDIDLLGQLTVSASLVLLTPEECLEELVLFHESKRRSRARAPRIDNSPPPSAVKPVIANAWHAPAAGRLARPVNRIVADDDTEDLTPLAHARRLQQEWAGELAQQICRTRWSEISKRAALLDDWMISRSNLNDLEQLLKAEWQRTPGLLNPILLPAAVIAPPAKAGDNLRFAVYRWLMRNKLIHHPLLEARLQVRLQLPLVVAVAVPVAIPVAVLPRAAVPTLGALSGLRLPVRVLEEMTLRDRLQAALNPQMKARLAAAPFVMAAPKPINRLVSLDLGPLVDALQKKLPVGELKIRPAQPSICQVADRIGPFDLYLEPPGARVTQLLQGVPRGTLWTVRQVGERYQLKVLDPALALDALIADEVVKQAVLQGSAKPEQVIAVLRAWIKPRDRLIDAASAGRLSAAAGNFSNPWETDPTLYQQSIFFRDEYRITESSRYGDVVGRRGGVYFADMLHAMSGSQHRYVQPTGPVLLAGFDATLWNQKLHFAGLMAPEKNGAALFMVARAELEVELAGVDLRFEGDLTLLSGSTWADQTRPGMKADSLSFSGAIDCQVGTALSIDMAAKGVLTRKANGVVAFDLQVGADMVLRIPIISVTVFGFTHRYRLAADVSLAGTLSNLEATGLAFDARINSLTFALQQWNKVNDKWKWRPVASVSVSGHVGYSHKGGLQVEVNFDVPNLLDIPAQVAANLDTDDAITYRDGKLKVVCELD